MVLSIKGGNESPHCIFGAALTKKPTAPELRRVRGEPKVLSVHSIGQSKQHAAASYSYCQGNDFSGPTTIVLAGRVKWTDFDETLHEDSLCSQASNTLLNNEGRRLNFPLKRA